MIIKSITINYSEPIMFVTNSSKITKVDTMVDLNSVLRTFTLLNLSVKSRKILSTKGYLVWKNSLYSFVYDFYGIFITS